VLVLKALADTVCAPSDTSVVSHWYEQGVPAQEATITSSIATFTWTGPFAALTWATTVTPPAAGEGTDNDTEGLSADRATSGDSSKIGTERAKAATSRPTRTMVVPPLAGDHQVPGEDLLSLPSVTRLSGLCP